MKELNRDEELAVLKYIDHCEDKLGNGGGRIVFDLYYNKEIFDVLGLANDRDYVVKVALGAGGCAQNENEYNAYMSCGNYVCLANIYAHGETLLVAEKVIIDDDLEEVIDRYNDCGDNIEDVVDYLWENYNHLYNNYAEAECAGEAVETLINELIDINGYTSDNSQIGISADGTLVAYDYGFHSEEGCMNQTSFTREFVDDINDLETFFSILIDKIEHSLIFSGSVLLHEVEADFYDYLDADGRADHIVFEESDEDDRICTVECVEETLDW